MYEYNDQTKQEIIRLFVSLDNKKNDMKITPARICLSLT